MQRDVSSLNHRQFDLLICGGGIYGAWTAYDAALRGLSVAIFDRGDWASGTSSASSKLIHGGLRYLETLDLKLVKKALAEREMLLEIAPHRIWPLRFGVPVYKDSRVGRLQLKIGLMLYDFLAGAIPIKQKHNYFSRQQFIKHFPVINRNNLNSGFSYFDAQTDDARLVLELIDGAITAGAVCLNYCQVKACYAQNHQVYNAEIRDLLSNQSVKLYARQMVNTTGPWLTELPEAKSSCRLSKGIHLIMPAILDDEALLLTAKADGRVFFMIPWYGQTLIGTTDDNYSGSLDSIEINQEEIDYLLNEVNHFLPDSNWTRNNILGQFAGLRVLQQSEEASPSKVSRDWELKTLPNGMHVSLGGKMTSAREDAAQIVDRVTKELNIQLSCKTRGRKLPWAPSESYPEWLDKNTDRAQSLGIDNESSNWLLKRHGKRVVDIFKFIEKDTDLAQRITASLPFIKADLVFCVQHEMVVHLEDVFRRRIPLLILNKPDIEEFKELAIMTGNLLGWDKAKINSETEFCTQKWQIQ